MSSAHRATLSWSEREKKTLKTRKTVFFQNFSENFFRDECKNECLRPIGRHCRGQNVKKDPKNQENRVFGEKKGTQYS